MMKSVIMFSVILLCITNKSVSAQDHKIGYGLQPLNWSHSIMRTPAQLGFGTDHFNFLPAKAFDIQHFDHLKNPVFLNFTDSLQKKRWYQTRAFRISIAPAALFTMAAISWNHRQEWRDLRNRFIPDFNNRFDDHLQYIPALMVYGLNWAGVKGKHTVKRATTSLLIGGAMAGLVTTSIKYTARELRPDDSEFNSFPSGHTTSAFVFATFLHKEYGHRSPLYSIAAYSMASWTGIMRQLNNRHWTSDVFAGAGIGLLFSELGYLITDKIYKDREFNPVPTITKYEKPLGNPSFLNVRIGYSINKGDLKDNRENIFARDGYSAGFQGAYFFNNYIGLGSELSFVSFIMNSDNINVEDPEINTITDYLETQPLGSRNTMIGPFFNYPINEGLSLTGKFVAGYSHGAKGMVYVKVKEEAQELLGSDVLPLLEYEPDDSFTWSTGLSLKKMVGRNVGLNLFFDYNFLKPNVTYSEIFDFDPDTNTYQKNNIETSNVNLNYVTMGFSMSAMLW